MTRPQQSNRSGAGWWSRSPVRFVAAQVATLFGIMSPLATGSVCGGKGSRALIEPVARCAFWRGTGVHPGSCMTCASCGGIGTVETPVHSMTCPGWKLLHGSISSHRYHNLWPLTASGILQVVVRGGPFLFVQQFRCGGSGRAADSIYPDSPLSCGCCRGKGVVFASSENLATVQFQKPGSRRMPNLWLRAHRRAIV
jgi:hypothetical protein